MYNKLRYPQGLKTSTVVITMMSPHHLAIISRNIKSLNSNKMPDNFLLVKI